MSANATVGSVHTLKADTQTAVDNGISLEAVNAFNAEKKSVKSSILQANPGMSRKIASQRALQQLSMNGVNTPPGAYKLCLIASELPKSIEKHRGMADADLRGVSENLAHAAVVEPEIDDPHLDFIADHVQAAARKNAEITRSAQNVFGANGQLNSVVGQTRSLMSQLSSIDGLQAQATDVARALPGFAAGLNARSKFQDDIVKFSFQHASPEERAEIQAMMPDIGR